MVFMEPEQSLDFAPTQSVRPRVRVRRLVIWVLLIGLSLIFIYPFFWMVTTSLKLRENIFVSPPQVIPNPVAWQNYVQVFENPLLWDWLRNTVLITAAQVVIGTLVSILVAYGFARHDFPGRRVVFMLLLATMMLPLQVIIVPLYIMFRNWGWLDTLWPFVVPPFLGGGAFGGGAFSIFLLRQFMMTLPPELDEAATLDGANSWQILWLILVPLCKPAIATVAVFAFLGSWNDFFAPFIFLSSPEHLTLAVGMQFYQTSDASEPNLLMGLAVLNIIPVVVLFLFAQKYFVSGIALTGLKG